jgi:hypothetical protein
MTREDPYYLVYGGWYANQPPSQYPKDPEDLEWVYGYYDWCGQSQEMACMALAEIQQYPFDFTGITVAFAT